MSDIKPGTIAYHKITEEGVFVLDIREGNPTQKFPLLSGKVAQVRRPVLGEDGIRYEVEYFTIEELETSEVGQKRKLAEMAELKARFDSGQAADKPATVAGKLEYSN